MTVAELIVELHKLPQDLDVVAIDDDGSYYYPNSAYATQDEGQEGEVVVIA